MALNVNGYNDTFQSFVDFARIRDGMGKKTAIARVTTGVTFSLDVAPDGKSAVVTIRLDNDLHEGHKNDDFFGKAVVRERITVDLRPEIPVVTDVQLGQELQ